MRELLGRLDSEAAFKLGQWLQMSKVKIKAQESEAVMLCYTGDACQLRCHTKHQEVWSFCWVHSLARRGLGYIGTFCHQPRVYQVGEGLYAIHTWASSLIAYKDCTALLFCLILSRGATQMSQLISLSNTWWQSTLSQHLLTQRAEQLKLFSHALEWIALLSTLLFVV